MTTEGSAKKRLVVSMAEAAGLLCVRQQTFREWVEAGVVRSVRWTPTSRPLIPLTELDRLVAEAASPAVVVGERVAS